MWEWRRELHLKRMMGWGEGQQDGQKTHGREAKNLLVGHVQQKIIMAEKIRPERRNRDRSQLEHPVKTTGSKT